MQNDDCQRELRDIKDDSRVLWKGKKQDVDSRQIGKQVHANLLVQKKKQEATADGR